MNTQMTTSKLVLKLSLISASVVFLHLLLPVYAVAADCKNASDAKLPVCQNATANPGDAGTMQTVTPGSSSTQKKAGQNATKNSGNTKPANKSNRKWIHSTNLTCVKGSITLHMESKNATCPDGFLKK
jgi:hypothetical protein